MKKNIFSLLVAPLFFAAVGQSTAQLPVISSFSQNGLLVCSNLAAYSVASVEWASSVSGPWHTNWTALTAVTVDTNGVIQVGVPMFYRVRGLAATTNQPADMALIPAGPFTMGDSLDGWTNAVPTNVTVSAFYMDVNLVSWNQWQSVYIWATNHGYGFVNAGSGKAANHPVQTVDWWDCVKWSNARSQQASLVPVYYTDAGLTQVYTNGEPATLYPNWSASGFRLPTEAEWEKAARGGLSGLRFPWGNIISQDLANYDGATNQFSYDLGPNSNNPAFQSGGTPYTSPIGYFPPNGYGLHDMAGNVLEWCWDWSALPYQGGSDPHGPEGPLTYRVARGGTYLLTALWARCANRTGGTPDGAYRYIGFRCAKRI